MTRVKDVSKSGGASADGVKAIRAAACDGAPTSDIKLSPFPRYTRGERLADFWIHVAGVCFGVAGFGGLIVLAAEQGRLIAWLALVIYGVALPATLVCSAFYNLTKPSLRKELLRRADHASIYVMIAATYTPFAITLPVVTGTGLLLFVWSAAGAGAYLSFCHPRRFETAAVALYLVQGWCFLAVAEGVLLALPRLSAILLLAGGLLYTVGAAFHHWHRLKYHNAIWHGCVLAGAICHYVAVVRLVLS